MQRVSPFGRLVSAVLFTALCAFLAAKLYSACENSGIISLTAVTVSESIAFEGIALRSEELLPSERELTYRPRDGERIPAGCELGEGIRTESSALFFAEADGFEYLSFEPESFSPSVLDRLLKAEKRETGGGRLVEGRFWYCGAYVDGQPSPGHCELRFDGFGEKLGGELICCCPDAGGKTAVLIKLPLGKTEYLSMRFCRGEIVTDEYTGLRLPESALTADSEGNCFVNRLTAAGKEKTAAEIIYRGDGFCLAAPSDKLTEGMRIREKDGYS